MLVVSSIKMIDIVMVNKLHKIGIKIPFVLEVMVVLVASLVVFIDQVATLTLLYG